MKNFWIFLCLFMLSAKLLKAQDTLMLYQAYPLFSDPEKAEWTAFQNAWNYFNYNALKEKYHIRHLNCKGCKSFYAEVLIEIGEKGHILKSVALRADHCGDRVIEKAILKDFEESVNKHRFTSLKNKRFVVRLGQVLNC